MNLLASWLRFSTAVLYPALKSQSKLSKLAWSQPALVHSSVSVAFFWLKLT